MNNFFYNNDGIIVRRSVKDDVNKFKDCLRKSDVEEIWASHNFKPEDALRMCVDKAILSLTVENGSPLAIFGINTDNILGDKAVVWMLATDDLDKIKMRFLRNCKHFIDIMLEYYPYLSNYVDARNDKSINWLKFLGAVIEPAKPYGAEGLPFHYFYFTRRV